MKRQTLRGIAFALGVAAVGLALLLIYKLATLLLLALIALVLTAGIEPIVQTLQLRIHYGERCLPRTPAALFIIITAALVIILVFVYIGYIATSEAKNFIENTWPIMQKDAIQALASAHARQPNLIPSPAVIQAKLAERSGDILNYLVLTSRAVIGFIGGIASLPLLLILTAFFTIYKDGIVYNVRQLIPPALQPRARELGHRVYEIVGGWMRGQLMLGLIIGSCVTVGLAALQVPYFALLGIVSGMGELIPMVGPYLAFIPTLIIAFATHAPLWQIIGICIFFIALSQIENFVLVPKVMQHHVKISPITTVFALFTGGMLLGILGALLAVPIAAALRVILLETVFPAIQGKTREEIEDASPIAQKRHAQAAGAVATSEDAGVTM